MKKAIQFTFIEEDKEKLIQLDLLLKSKLEGDGRYDLREEGVCKVHFPDGAMQYRKNYIVRLKTNHKAKYNETYGIINSVKPVHYTII